ncbi:hypothetical protein BJ165DRAFT_1416187 [Panaeolus papilionaceus]|nr:hypothetical protein BJ165DRAFT_1416187 [Panaeolus papilionaceus]
MMMVLGRHVIVGIPSSSGSLARPSLAPGVTFIPNTAPAGVLSITQPPQTATSFYKIAPNELITFGWNTTFVLVTPTHLTVSAVCNNGKTYPVGPSDGVIPGTATQVVWDPYAYQLANPQDPLPQATYTLNIWDDRGPGQPISRGRLQQNSALQFALYTPQPYTALASGWTCATCNGAMTYASHPAFISLFVTLCIAFFSGFHLLRTTARA